MKMKNKIILSLLSIFLLVSFVSGIPVTTLTSPSNNSLISNPWDFIGGVTGDSDNISNCSLYADWSGAWVEEGYGVPVSQVITFDKIELPRSGTFMWNIMCINASGSSDWFTNNYTVRLWSPVLGNNQAGVKGFMVELGEFIPVIVIVIVALIPILFIFIILGWIAGIFDNIFDAIGLQMLKSNKRK